MPITGPSRRRLGTRPARPGQLPEVADLAQRSPQVTECHRITDDDCFLLKIHDPSIEGLEALFDTFLMFGQTTTAVVVTTPVEARSPVVTDGS